MIVIGFVLVVEVDVVFIVYDIFVDCVLFKDELFGEFIFGVVLIMFIGLVLLVFFELRDCYLGIWVWIVFGLFN